jgi:membrane-associated phospholipid phosphatase
VLVAERVVVWRRILVGRWALALTAFVVLVWAWVSWRIDSTPPVDESLGGETDRESLRWVAGTLSSLGSFETRVVLLSIVLTSLFAARRFLDGLYVVMAMYVVHALERVVKAGEGRLRPLDPESGYFPSDWVRLAFMTCVVLGAMVWWSARGASPWRLVSVAALGGLLYLIGRLAGEIDVPARAGAFPSGHAANTMALAASLILIRRRQLSRPAAVAVVCSAAALVIAIGWSRVALGYHHPTDVIAGWALAVILAVVIDAGRRIVDRYSHPVSSPPRPDRLTSV